MDVDRAIRVAHADGFITTAVMRAAASELAYEVERLRFELVCANAEQERLENQLDSVRSELVAATLKLDEWERVQIVAAEIADVLSTKGILPR